MRYVKVTFSPHINELHLLDEFQILFNVILHKQETYCVTREKVGEPNEHIHAIFSTTAKDEQKVRQLFLNKGWDDFRKQLVQTEWDPMMKIKAFQAIRIENDDHNPIMWLGYINKQFSKLIDSKGYTEDFITQAIKYHTQNTRHNETLIEKYEIHDLNTKNCKAYMRHYCEKYDISLKDKRLTSKLAKVGVATDNIGTKQMTRVIAFLNLHKNEMSKKTHLSEKEESKYENILDSDITKTENDSFKEYEDMCDQMVYWKEMYYSSNPCPCAYGKHATTK